MRDGMVVNQSTVLQVSAMLGGPSVGATSADVGDFGDQQRLSGSCKSLFLEPIRVEDFGDQLRQSGSCRTFPRAYPGRRRVLLSGPTILFYFSGGSGTRSASGECMNSKLLLSVSMQILATQI